MSYLNRAYDVLNSCNLTSVPPHVRQEIASAFAEALEEVEAAALGRCASYLRAAADFMDPPHEDEAGEVV